MGREIFIVAGEPSGDQHAAGLLEALRARDPDLLAAGFGGPRLAAAGMDLLEDLASEAVMGLFPVLASLPRIRGWFRRAEEELGRRRPAALILVDYPGFNLRLARIARRLGIPVIYYIAPQVWAWKEGRVKAMRERIDLLLTILSFEPAWFAERGLEAVDCGHPLADRLARERPDPGRVAALRAGAETVLGLFPGSRPHVVRALAPDFLEVAATLQARRAGRLRVLLAAADQAIAEALRQLVPTGRDDLEIVVGESFAVMAAADACLSTSGTTTIEIAGFRKPMTIAYRVSPLVHAIGRLLVKVKSIGLVNLVAGRMIAPEIIGSTRLVDRLLPAVERSLDPTRREATVAAIDAEVLAKLGPPGSYDRAAERILGFLDAR
ncbi:MAG: lipid-A-disaccharide synthase [Planctomycetes bacterium]|nr:lipid-A-disaccharide synthase [Planctomycetota bacterium]